MKKDKEKDNEMKTRIVVETKARNTIRVYEIDRKKAETTIQRNKGLVGDSIEVMMERLREGDSEDSIQDRDLVYNDQESSIVNPVTNIRSDKFELMLEEKVGEYEHRERKMKVVKDEEVKEEKAGENGTEGPVE